MVKNTKTQILDAAEKMFAANGFAGTTLRNLVKEAGVNLAAVSYHFGSKEELFRAVVARMAQPIVQCELEAADTLEAYSKQKGSQVTLEGVLTAFFQPPLKYLIQDEQLRVTRALFMGRCRSEPAPIQGIAAQEFEASVVRFLDLLQQAVPDQSREQLIWKLDLAITILVRTLTEVGQSGALLQGNSTADIETAVAELVRFTAAGIRGEMG